MNKSIILHPYLFAVFPSVSLVADHLGFIEFNGTVLLAGAGTVLITAVFTRTARHFSPDRHKISFIATFSLLWFFAYGHVFDFLNDFFPTVHHRGLLIFWIILLFAGLFLLLRYRNDSPQAITQALTVISGLLLLISLVQIAGYELETRRLMWRPAPLGNDRNGARFSGGEAPDIYYIVLDAYAGSNTLRELYGFDNDDFLQALADRGFYIAAESRSNYAITTLSLASSLNFTHVNMLEEKLGEDTRDTQLTREIILDNRANQFLKRRGYQYIFLGSGFGVTQNNPYADIDIRCGQVDETVGRYIKTTVLRAFADKSQLIRRDERRWRLCMFDTLARIPQTNPGPKFVFAHIPVPHWPFLFDAEGNYVRITQPLGRDGEKAHYVEQLKYLNGRVVEIIDAIIANSDREPVIILQADHGPAIETGEAATRGRPTPAHFRERMSILNAYYLPGSNSGQLYETITPVNSLPVIFNSTFGTDFPLAPDESFYSFYEQPYRFINVTATVGPDTSQ